MLPVTTWKGEHFQTLFKRKFVFSFVYTLISRHPMHNNWFLAIKFVFNLHINKNMTEICLSNLHLSAEKQAVDLFVINLRVHHKTPSWEEIHPIFLMFVYENNSCRQTVLITDTFFQFLRVFTYEGIDCGSSEVC